VFDYGVNSGISRAVKVLQRLVRLNADGRMNEVLLGALARHDTEDLVGRLCDERLAFLKSLSTWPVFGAGWGRRVADVRRASLALARGGMAEEPRPNVSGRASVQPGRTAPGAAAGGAVIAGGVATQAAHAAGASWPAIAGIVLLTLLVVALCWFGWRWWQARRQDAPVPAAEAGLCSGLCRTLKGWKTLVFGSVVATTGMVADLLDALKAIDISPLLPPSYAVKIIAAIGVITIMLRFATTGLAAGCSTVSLRASPNISGNKRATISPVIRRASPPTARSRWRISMPSWNRARCRRKSCTRIAAGG
jgi:hypothetical protein